MPRFVIERKVRLAVIADAPAEAERIARRWQRSLETRDFAAIENFAHTETAIALRTEIPFGTDAPAGGEGSDLPAPVPTNDEPISAPPPEPGSSPNTPDSPTPWEPPLPQGILAVGKRRWWQRR